MYSKYEVENNKQVLSFFRKNLAEIMLSLSLVIPQGVNADVGKITTRLDRTRYSMATATVINGKKCMALTNKHIKKRMDSTNYVPKIKLENGKEYELSVLYTDPNNDLVLLQLLEKIRSGKSKPARNCDKNPYNRLSAIRKGEPVKTIGYPARKRNTVIDNGKMKKETTLRKLEAEGENVSDSKKFLKVDKKIIIISGTTVVGGQSGSPVLNAKGELTGIIFAGRRGIWLAHDVKSIKAIFDRFKIPYTFNK